MCDGCSGFTHLSTVTHDLPGEALPPVMCGSKPLCGAMKSKHYMINQSAAISFESLRDSQGPGQLEPVNQSGLLSFMHCGVENQSQGRRTLVEVNRGSA